MGGWKLEVFRMAIYVSLPIVSFYLFNKPEYFKEYLAKTKRFYLIEEDPDAIKQLSDFRKAKEEEKEKAIRAEIDQLKNRSK